MTVAAQPVARGPHLMIALGCIVALTVLGCSSGAEGPGRASDPPNDLVIAAAWPWELRKEIRYGEGLQMAIDEENAAGAIGGRRLRLAKYDDQESINHGRVIAQEIVQTPNVVATIGHLQSYITVEVASVYTQAGLLLLAPTASDPELTARNDPRVFRICFTDQQIGQELAGVAAARGWKRVAVAYIRNQYGRNVANSFEARATQLGLSIPARGSYDPSEQASELTFDRLLNEWRTLDLDAILLAGEVPSAGLFIAGARKRGITVPIIGGDAMSSPGLMTSAGAAAEGVIVASYFHPDDPRPEVARFKSAFRKRHGFDPDAGSALGYDSVKILVDAMRTAKSTAPDDIARALRQMRSWNGITGPLAFGANGDAINRQIVLSVVRGGQFEYVKPSL